jgi:WD40 repeat protein
LTWDGLIYLCDPRTADISKTYRVEQPDRTASKLVANRNGELLAIIADRVVKVFDLQNERVVASIYQRSNALDVAFLGDGSTLAILSGDKQLRLWDIRTSQALFDIKGAGFPHSLAASSDGCSLAVAGERDITILDGKPEPAGNSTVPTTSR